MRDRPVLQAWCITESHARGRPRSAAVHRDILEATRALIVAKGYSKVSMDRVAARAEIGVQTVYRRWPSKSPLVAEAIPDATNRFGPIEMPDTGDIGADLRAWLRLSAEFLAAPGNRVFAPGLGSGSRHRCRSRSGPLPGPTHDAIVQRPDRAVRAG
ncbi:TetR/AcrR family transcriptional regulator [Mycobacterium lacus]|nr:TetR/AcrR family transcriptional regulator [Mycobacterium lacus]MCV7123772.1 TetR/AcrR family transcriptional regulator [Mycobacterium lacus]